MVNEKRGYTKSAQAAVGAAFLLAVIAGAIILFIVLMPPAERAELLGEPTSTTSSGITTTKTALNLLTVSPGRIDFISQREIEHPLPSINIFTRTEALSLAEKGRIYVKHSLFSEENSILRFTVEDLSQVKNVLLSLQPKNVEGNLIITLNGEAIFNSPLEGDFAPLSISSSQLQTENELIFSVSSPGGAFWKTNEALLENVIVVGDLTSTENQESLRRFLISETEKDNLEKIILRFQPVCAYGEVGRLVIFLNGREIYASIPDCDIASVLLEIAPEQIMGGENQLIFRSEKGDYFISHILIKSELKDVEYPVYYFELSESDYDKVESGDYNLQIQANFVETTSIKKGEFVFNGHVKNFETKKLTYTIDMSEDIVSGTNSLQLRPLRTLEIRELKVDLVE